MQARLFSPIACRCAGMRTSYLDLFRWDEEARGLEEEAARELLDRQRLDLWGLLDEVAYTGCLASMNPDVSHQLEAEHRKGRATKPRSNTTIRKERLLYRFLARFVGRNDQTGLAGTSFWGYFAEGDRDLRVRGGRSGRRAARGRPGGTTSGGVAPGGGSAGAVGRPGSP